MREMLKAAASAFMEGVRETPRGFFAPVTGTFRLLSRAVNDEIGRSAATHPRPRRDHHVKPQ